MSNVVIRVENLGKKYQIGASETKRDTIREVIVDTLKAPFKRFGSLSGANQNDHSFWALKDVSFDVQQGDVVGIIGRNGAGKSTLLKILSKIVEPTEGVVKIKGRISSLLEVGTGFHPELTGRENIYLNGAIIGMSRAEINRKFDEIVAFSEIEKFLDTPVKRYSSGMYVRLAFAVAAHLEPEILIIDEVLAVGDAAFQKKCLGKMQEVGKEGRSVLFVSHNMAAIEQLTHRGILLRNGNLIHDCNTPEAVAAYMETVAVESAIRFNVENSPRKFHGNQAARFVELYFTRAQPVFYPDEDFQFIARVRAFEKLDHLRISMTIFSNDGVAVGSCFGPNFANMEFGSEAEIEVTLKRPRLAPGHYYCGLSVGKGNHTTGHIDYDVVLETLGFDVRPDEGESGTLANWARAWGSLVFTELKQRIITTEEYPNEHK